MVWIICGSRVAPTVFPQDACCAGDVKGDGGNLLWPDLYEMMAAAPFVRRADINTSKNEAAPSQRPLQVSPQSNS